MALSAGARLGAYEIVSAIGSGGMGEVYRAVDTRLNRTVALKIITGDALADPERRRRFLTEARAASALNHPNIITIHGSRRRTESQVESQLFRIPGSVSFSVRPV